MNGLWATKGTMLSSSYAKTLRPPIQTSTTIRPMRVTVMPTRSKRAASSNSLVVLSIEKPSFCQAVLGSRCPLSQLPQEGHEVRLLLLAELQPLHEVEELHRVLQRQAAAVVEVRRAVLDAPQREGLH